MKLYLISIPRSPGAPHLRPVLFSMVTRNAGGDPSSAHLKKHTQYTIDAEFELHLRTCPICCQQLCESLRETLAMLEGGTWGRQ